MTDFIYDDYIPGAGSTSVAGLWYNREERELGVRFRSDKSTIYVYKDVPAVVWTNLVHAPSLGYQMSRIKSAYGPATAQHATTSSRPLHPARDAAPAAKTKRFIVEYTVQIEVKAENVLDALSIAAEEHDLRDFTTESVYGREAYDSE